MSLQEEVIRPQVDQFERDGYLVVPDVLSPEKVDRLNAAIDEVLAEEEPSVAHNIYHCINRHPELASLIDEPTILPLIVNILGYNIQFFISNLSVRYPNPDDQQAQTWASINWHQDGPNPHFPKVDAANGRRRPDTQGRSAELRQAGRRVPIRSKHLAFRPTQPLAVYTQTVAVRL